MNYNERMNTIVKMIQNKRFKEAEEELLLMLNESEIKEVSDDKYVYYTFYDYIEVLIFIKYFGIDKEHKNIEYNISQIYYYLGCVNIEMKNFGKAMEYLNKGEEWNPVSVPIKSYKATTYRLMGEIEKFKEEIKNLYKYIYIPEDMFVYYSQLALYYKEKRKFDIAKALYTYSLDFRKDEISTKIVMTDLKYIAEQEQKNVEFTPMEEIKKLLNEYNIPLNFNKETVDVIFNEYQKLVKENKDIENIRYFSKIMYKITLDRKFLLFDTIKDKKLGIDISIPVDWKIMDRLYCERYGASPDTVFIFFTSQNQLVTMTCKGKCLEKDFDNVYQENLQSIEKEGNKVVTYFSIKGQHNIYETFVDIPNGEKTRRFIYNYLIANDYLFNISWEVPSALKPEEILSGINNSIAMQVVFSLKKSEDAPKISEKNESSIKDNKPKEELEVFSQDMEKYPTFAFYFPKDIGEKVKIQYNVFEIRKDKKQVIRVMVSKCSDENNVKNIADKWIEKNKKSHDRVLKSYEREKVSGKIVHKYILTSEKLEDKIYKFFYFDKCFIAISGSLKNNKEDIINTAIEKIHLIEKSEKKVDNNAEENKSIIVKCPSCQNEFKLNWNVPVTEKSFYCRCPNCNAEIHRSNPNYKE